MWRGVLLAALLTSGAASAQTDGNYRGTLECESLPRSGDALSAPVTLTVSGRIARFERTVMHPQFGTPAGAETGQARVGGNGQLTLRTLWRGERDTIRGTYSGRLTAAGGIFRGRQSVSAERRIHSRGCTITLQR